MLIDVFAGTSDEDPVFEELPARQLGIATHELLSSPGLALNMARGDVIFIEDRSTHAVVLERGGNFCIHIYADHIPVEDIAGLKAMSDATWVARWMGCFREIYRWPYLRATGWTRSMSFLIGFAIEPGLNGITRTSIKIWMTMMTRRF